MKLSASDKELWREALRRFAIRDWWMVHELLEELWRRRRAAGDDDAASLYQGLLQAAVCLYHMGNGNFAGARPLASRSLALLQGREHADLDLPAFTTAFAETVRPMLEGAPVRPLHPDEIPELKVV